MTEAPSKLSAVSFSLQKSIRLFGACSLIAVVSLFSNGASAAIPSEAEVQGWYEGKGKDQSGEFRIEARVVAQGEGNYKVLVRAMQEGDKGENAEFTGKTTGETVEFQGQVDGAEWKGRLAEGVIKGDSNQAGTFEARRVEKKSPATGKKAPEGAVVLLDGKHFEEMVRSNGAEWDLGEVGKDGSIQVPKGGMKSKHEFENSFNLHVEFQNPLQPKEHSQGRGNSGVYLPNGDEIQVLDSFGEATYVGGCCGGLYRYKDPDSMETIESLANNPENKYPLTSFPPLTWQTYDIEYRVEKKDGQYSGKPRVTVFHNGIKIHDNAELKNEARKGSFQFQDHGNAVRYRNIWVQPIAEK